MAKKIIGDREYDFRMMPASVATEVEVTIAGVATEAVVKLLSAQGADETKQAEAMASAVGTLATAIGRLGPGKTTELMGTLFQYVRVDGENGEGVRPANLDLDFTGKPKLKWLVIFEALRVNFADFFPAGLSLSSAESAPK